MDQLFQAIRNLPPPSIWAVITFVVGATLTGLAYHLVLRRYGPLQSKVLQGLAEANDRLVETQKSHMEMMERTLLMQKEHYEAQVKEAKEEWLACRKELHAKREEWNAESLRMQLVIQELEGRPDMRTLSEGVANLVELIKDIATNLDRHDKSIDARMEKFMKGRK